MDLKSGYSFKVCPEKEEKKEKEMGINS